MRPVTDTNHSPASTSASTSAKVVTWTSIEKRFAGTGDVANGGALLLGNGFSSNIWSSFGYRSLLDESSLQGEARDLFGDRFNFETVLADLSVARRVVGIAAPHDTRLAARLDKLQSEVRDALIETVGRVHPDANQLLAAKYVGGGILQGVPLFAIDEVARHLPRYSRIFVTNYDLVSYWASVHAGVADLFSASNPFDVDQAEQWLATNLQPKIFFLHGALHLWRSLSTNREGKRTAQPSTRLLDVIRASVEDPDLVPLFISEGSSAEKVARIRASQYLSFCARALDATESPITVLGQALVEVDEHIAASIQARAARPVAVGVYVGNQVNARARADALLTQANEIQGRLSQCRNMIFFDSAEHPLTRAALHCG